MAITTQIISIEPIDEEAMPTPNLGDPGATKEIGVRTMLDRFTKGQSFRVRWYGGRVPAGVELGGFRIIHTQHGCVYAEGGAIVGSYERIIDGQQTEDGWLNEMIITLFGGREKR